MEQNFAFVTVMHKLTIIWRCRGSLPHG